MNALNDMGDQLREIISMAYVPLKNKSNDELSSKESPGKWSEKEIIGHLIDSAYNNHQRFLRAMDQDHLVFNGYDQEKWVIHNNYQQRESYEVIECWKMSNMQLAELIDRIPKNKLEYETIDHNFHKICMVRPEKNSISSLKYLISDYLFHLEHHLQQILPNYLRIHVD